MRRAALILTGCLATITQAQVLTNAPTVLVIPQGLAQQALSIQGSGYSQVGVSLNGLELTLPWSAHFNTDLPLPAQALSEERIDDSVAFKLLDPEAENRASAKIGTKERYGASLAGGSESTTGFVEWEKARRIDYVANGLESLTGGACGQQFRKDWQIDWQAAHQKKTFGAQGYYGLASSTYAEEETRDSLLLASALLGELDGAFLRTALAWRRFEDLYRIPSENVENDVRSQLSTAMIEGRTIEVQDITLNLHGDLKYERIDGDSGTHDRTRGSLTLRPEWLYKALRFKAGFDLVVQSDESADWLPRAGIDWLAGDNTTLYLDYSENVQQPDFQLLYYADPFRSGNPDLQQQHTRNIAFGIRQFTSATLDWHAALFHRRQENAADWVNQTATDLGTVRVSGVESQLNVYPSEKLDLKLFYQWIEKSGTARNGLYESDFPTHLLALVGSWDVHPELHLALQQTLRVHDDHPQRQGSNTGTDATLSLHYAPHFAQNLRLSLHVENLWGSTFEPIPDLKPRPTSVSSGLTLTW